MKAEEKKIRERKSVYTEVGDAFVRAGYYNSKNKSINFRNCVTLDLYSTVDEMIKFLTEVKEKYGADYTNMRFESQTDYDGDVTWYLWGWHLESDAEYNFRVERELKALVDKEEKERKEFERLAKKFAKT